MILNAILATASLCIGAWIASVLQSLPPVVPLKKVKDYQGRHVTVCGRVLEAVVLQDGTVRAARVLHGPRPDFGLDQEAVNAVRQWRLKPGTDGKRPANVVVPIELSFRLK
jgi:TonB family protein